MLDGLLPKKKNIPHPKKMVSLRQALLFLDYESCEILTEWGGHLYPTPWKTRAGSNLWLVVPRENPLEMYWPPDPATVQMYTYDEWCDIFPNCMALSDYIMWSLNPWWSLPLFDRTLFWSHTSYESRFLVSTFKGVGKSGVFFSDTRNCSNVGSVGSRTTNGRGKGPSQEFECILESLASNGCLSFLCLVMALRNMADTNNQNQLVFFQRVCWIIHNPSCVAAAHSEERVPLQLRLQEPLQSNLWQQQGIQYPVSLSRKVWTKLTTSTSNFQQPAGGGWGVAGQGRSKREVHAPSLQLLTLLLMPAICF